MSGFDDDNDLLDDAIGCLGSMVKYVIPVVSILIAGAALNHSYETSEQQAAYQTHQLELQKHEQEEQQRFQSEQRILWARNEARFNPRLNYVNGKVSENRVVLTFKNDSSVACVIRHYRFVIDSESTLQEIAKIDPRPTRHGPYVTNSMKTAASLENPRKDIVFSDGNWIGHQYEFVMMASENFAAGAVGDLSFSIDGVKWHAIRNARFCGTLYLYYDSPEPLILSGTCLGFATPDHRGPLSRPGTF